MKHELLKSLAVYFALQAPVGFAWFATNPGPIGRAHAAFLARDYGAMANHLKETLADPTSSEAMRQNAVELLEKAYSVKSGSPIPVDWTLPKEITDMKVKVRHTRRFEQGAYGLKVQGNMLERNLIQQLQIIRYPDQIVLDRKGKIGDWSEIEEPKDGIYFELDGPNTPEPAADGLYLLNLEMRDGRVVNGWFILSHLVSSETPTVLSPAHGQHFTTANPTFKWDNFYSPEYQSFERRNLWMGITTAEPPTFAYNEVWTLFEPSPTRTEVTVGTEAAAMGVKQLKEGRYAVLVGYSEIRRFGPLKLARGSLTVIPFSVKPK